MSKLRLWSRQGDWQLNVTSFSSPITAQITSVQTKTMAHHYPIKVTQPDLQLSVQFVSETEFEKFQKFVRSHQQDAQATAKLVFLSWPERNIDNWTGIIKQFKAGGMRRNYAPKASFSVDLVDSLVSSRADISTVAQDLWQTIYGVGMKDGVLGLPSASENQFAGEQFGQDLYGNITGGNPSPLPNPAQPGFGPSGILSGS